MANRVIFTTYFRASYPHLDKPQQPQKPTDTPKYSLGMMFPKSGVCPINNMPSNVNNIVAALDEVCGEQWRNPQTGAGLTFAEATAPGMGIQFPPKFKDGDFVFEKDSNGNPIPGQVNPNSAGMIILSVKNAEPVGVAGADGSDIHPTAVYAGCWCRAQLEVSAYDGSQGRVVAVKLLNVQMCYDDTKIGGKPVYQSAGQAFAGMQVNDTNIPTGYGQSGAMPPAAPATVPGMAPQANVPGMVPQAPQATVPGMVPQAPQAPQATVPGMAPQANVPGMAPQAPQATVPGMVPQANVPGMAPQANVPGMVPQAPQANVPSMVPQVAPTCPVVMNAGEAPYEAYVAQGWTPEMLIQHGKAQPNYLSAPVA